MWLYPILTFTLLIYITISQSSPRVPIYTDIQGIGVTLTGATFTIGCETIDYIYVNSRQTYLFQTADFGQTGDMITTPISTRTNNFTIIYQEDVTTGSAYSFINSTHVILQGNNISVYDYYAPVPAPTIYLGSVQMIITAGQMFVDYGEAAFANLTLVSNNVGNGAAYFQNDNTDVRSFLPLPSLSFPSVILTPSSCDYTATASAHTSGVWLYLANCTTTPSICTVPTPVCNSSSGTCITCVEYDVVTPIWNSSQSECQTCAEYDQAFPIWNGTACISHELCNISAPVWNGTDCVTCQEFNSSTPIWDNTTSMCIGCSYPTPVIDNLTCLTCQDNDTNTPYWNGSVCISCVNYNNATPIYDNMTDSCITCLSNNNSLPVWNGTVCESCYNYDHNIPIWNGSLCLSCYATNLTAPVWDGHTCITCVANSTQFPIQNGSHCISCVSNNQSLPIWNGTYQSCINCATNDTRYPIWNGNTCIACGPMAPVWNGTQCTSCSVAGSTTPIWNGMQCISCYANNTNFPLWDGLQCTACPIGQVWLINVQMCVPTGTCPSSYFRLANGSCIYPCQPPYTSIFYPISIFTGTGYYLADLAYTTYKYQCSPCSVTYGAGFVWDSVSQTCTTCLNINPELPVYIRSGQNSYTSYTSQGFWLLPYTSIYQASDVCTTCVQSNPMTPYWDGSKCLECLSQSSCQGSYPPLTIYPDVVSGYESNPVRPIGVNAVFKCPVGQEFIGSGSAVTCCITPNQARTLVSKCANGVCAYCTSNADCIYPTASCVNGLCQQKCSCGIADADGICRGNYADINTISIVLIMLVLLLTIVV